MSEKDNPDPLNRPAGSVSLTKYRAHGGGIELFRAYVERRKADQQTNLDRKAEVIATMNPEAGGGVLVGVFERARVELTMIQILEELDPIVRDLLRFCEREKRDDDDPIVDLNSALRIGKHHAPNDSFNTERGWEIEQRWVAAYLHMQDTLEFVSFNQLAIQIGQAVGVSDRTAKNHWEKKVERQPRQALWAQQIQDRAKQHAALVRESADEAKAAKKAETVKPKKSDYRKNNL